VLGNAVLHMTLWILASLIELPTQEQIDALLVSETTSGDYECVSADDLYKAVDAAKMLHSVAFVLLLYQTLHNDIW